MKDKHHTVVFDIFGFGKLNAKLDKLLRKVDKLATDQAAFDEHLATLLSAVGELIAAVEALLANKTDFTAEDTAVQEAAANARAELDKIPPPPSAEATPAEPAAEGGTAEV